MERNNETQKMINEILNCRKLHSFVFHNKHWCLAIENNELYYLLKKIKPNMSYDITKIDFEKIRHMIFQLECGGF